MWWRRMDLFSDTKLWDWAVIATFFAGVLSILFIAVVDFDVPAYDLELRWLIGFGVSVFGWMLFTWCSFANPFFDAMVRIQNDGHRVMDEGPYSLGMLSTQQEFAFAWFRVFGNPSYTIIFELS